MTPFTCPRSCPLANERWCRFRAITDLIGPVRVDSHIAEVAIEVRDLDALETACKRIGLEFRRDRKEYRWYGESTGPTPEGMTEDELGKCVHAIGIPGSLAAYEIGVIQRAGSYGLAFDNWHGGYGLEAVAGAGCKKLIEEYSVVVAERAAAMQGWLTERTANGALIVHHPSGGTLTLNAGMLDASGFVGESCHAATLELGLPLANVTSKMEGSQVRASIETMS